MHPILFKGSLILIGICSLFLCVYFLASSFYWKSMAYGALWLVALWRSPKFISLMLGLVSLWPFVFSPMFFMKRGYQVDFFYQWAEASPLYQWFRNFQNPWNSPWSYTDSPFHYGVETSSFVFSNILAIVVMMTIVLSVFRFHAKG